MLVCPECGCAPDVGPSWLPRHWKLSVCAIMAIGISVHAIVNRERLRAEGVRGLVPTSIMIWSWGTDCMRSPRLNDWLKTRLADSMGFPSGEGMWDWQAMSLTTSAMTVLLKSETEGEDTNFAIQWLLFAAPHRACDLWTWEQLLDSRVQRIRSFGARKIWVALESGASLAPGVLENHKEVAKSRGDMLVWAVLDEGSRIVKQRKAGR